MGKWMRGGWLAAATLGMLTGYAAQAQDDGITETTRPEDTSVKATQQAEPGAKATGKLDRREAALANQLALFDQQQIALARLAQQKAQDPKVKGLANTLAQSHQRHLSDLEEWAATKSITIARIDAPMVPGQAVGGSGMEPGMEGGQQPGAQQQPAQDPAWTRELARGEKEQKELSSRSGADFDRMYVEAVTKDQERERDAVRKGRGSVEQDPVLTAFLVKTEKHLDGNIEQLKRLRHHVE